jgi:thiosulfate dehydrogenase [quinone] large subunit
MSSPIADWLFMLSLLGLGVALLFGIFTKVASYGGMVLVVLMWLALLPPEHNPVLDEHIIYALVLFGISKFGATGWWTVLVGKRTWMR